MVFRWARNEFKTCSSISNYLFLSCFRSSIFMFSFFILRLYQVCFLPTVLSLKPALNLQCFLRILTAPGNIGPGSGKSRVNLKPKMMLLARGQ